MELLPIIYKVLLLCIILFVLVLALSYLFSKTSKSKDIDYKRIVEERKRAHLEEYTRYKNEVIAGEYISAQNSFYDKISSQQIRRSKRHSRDLNQNKKKSADIALKNPLPDFDNKKRYTVLNETMNTEFLQEKGNKEVKIFYPINFQKSA